MKNGRSDLVLGLLRFCHIRLGKAVTKVSEIKVESLTEQEKKLIQIIRELGYGELNITVKAGKPILVNEIRKSIQLNEK